MTKEAYNGEIEIEANCASYEVSDNNSMIRPKVSATSVHRLEIIKLKSSYTLVIR